MMANDGFCLSEKVLERYNEIQDGKACENLCLKGDNKNVVQSIIFKDR